MTITNKDGLIYSLADVHDGMRANIDMMASKEPGVASAARLNRDLVAALDNWLHDESRRGTNVTDVMTAIMHGVTTVCGTIAVQVPHHDRKEVLILMRKHMLSIFDVMANVVCETD